MNKRGSSVQPAGQKFARATTRQAGQNPFSLVCPTTETPREQKFQDARKGGQATAAELPPWRAPIGV
eukprot:8068781-Karenia_brevis.AAC.1